MLISCLPLSLSLLVFPTRSPPNLPFQPKNGPPYPAKPWQIPFIHHSPNCLHKNGWHDVAGALTFQATHHVFQGCPASGGWSHAASSDLVHWEDRGIHVSQIQETYKGMDSLSSPCSGFVSLNDQGVPCAGFRQCSSSKGVVKLNPNAQPWDVPMEIRCSENEQLTNWSLPTFIYPVYYYRALPYDPVRPWIDFDGKWYSALSTDGCNSTTKKLPCAAGGRLDLFRADHFNGPWLQINPMFTTNVTYRGFGHPEPGHITREFVTSGYFGGLIGDPDNGKTRIVTQNNGGATFWVGKQSNGSTFLPYWDTPGAVGYYDYGTLTMARTLGSDSNQVAKNGRRVLIGWIGGTPASQSLARELTLSSTHEMLQQFVPELKSLRKNGRGTNVSAQVELVATFIAPTGKSGIHIMCDTISCGSIISIDCSENVMQGDFKECMVGVGDTTAPLLLQKEGKVVSDVSVHAIVDGEIIEVIFNNRTAMVVYQSAPRSLMTGVSIFAPAGVDASVTTWDLEMSGLR